MNLASPLEIAGLVAAVAWPFALGLAVVLWSKSRAAARRRRLAALDAELRGLFRTVEGRRVPERLALVVEALEEAQAMQPRKPAEAGRKAPITAS